MQITTLMQSELAISSVQYVRLDSNSLTIKIITSAPHGIYGNVKIQLANVQDIKVGIDKDPDIGIDDYFNTELINFIRTGDTTLEGTIQWSIESFLSANAISPNTIWTNLPNNGNDITAFVDNIKVLSENAGKKSIHFDDRSNYAGESNGFAVFTLTQYFKIDSNNETKTTTFQKCNSLQNNSIQDIYGDKVEYGIEEFNENTKLILTII